MKSANFQDRMNAQFSSLCELFCKGADSFELGLSIEKLASLWLSQYPGALAEAEKQVQEIRKAGGLAAYQRLHKDDDGLTDAERRYAAGVKRKTLASHVIPPAIQERIDAAPRIERMLGESDSRARDTVFGQVRTTLGAYAVKLKQNGRADLMDRLQAIVASGPDRTPIDEMTDAIADARAAAMN